MGRVREKVGACLHRGQMTTFALDAQLLLNATLLSHQADQRSGLMGVELIGNEDPARLWISCDGLVDVRDEVGFGARGSQAGRDDLAGGHIQVGDQAEGAVAFIFEFLSLDVTGQHRQGRMKPFEGLDTGHLVGAHHMRGRRRKRGGRFIHLTDGADLFGQLRRIVGRGSQPIALAMRL
jgi:hypothetical protein